jgi:hypothetical protein
MEHRLRDRMVLHGTVVIVIGLLAGFPHALVITGQLAGSERAWRMAHLEGVLNGLLVLVVAAVADRLVLSRRRHAVIAWSLIVAAYGNVVASILGAMWNVRGLNASPPGTNLVVYAIFFVAVVGVFLGLVLLAMSAARRSRVATAGPEAAL